MVCVLASMALFPAMATDLYLPAFPNIAHDYGVSSSDLQITLGASFLGLAIGQPLWGPISDRFGRKGPAILGSVLFIFGSLASSMAQNVALLSAGRAVQALGGAASVLIGRAIVRDLFQGKEMARTLSLVASIFMIGPIVAPSLGALILQVSDWRGVFYALAAFGFLVILGILTLPESLPKGSRNRNDVRSAILQYGRIWRDSDFRFAAMQISTNTLILFTYVASSPSVMMQGYGVSQQLFGVLFGANAAVILLGTQLNRWLLKRLEVATVLKRMVIGQFVAATLLCVFGLLLHQLWIVVALLMFTTIYSPSVAGNATTLALQNFKNNAAQAAAMVGVVQGISAAATATILTALPGDSQTKMLLGLFGFSTIAQVVLFVRGRYSRRLAR